MTTSPLRAAVAPSPIPSLSTEQFNLLVLSDLHLTAHPSATELLLSNREYLDRLDHAVFLGDQVACYGTDHEYGVLSSFTERLALPYSPVNGNHEFYFEMHDEQSGEYGKLWGENSLHGKTSQLRKFREFFNLPELWRIERNEFGNFLFVGLDGVEHHKAETISDAQIEFLTEQVRANYDAPLFVFCHAPLMLRERLDMEYYVADWTACIEPQGELLDAIEARRQPLLWMSGHIHLHPDHYLFAPYQLSEKVWQVHCPDSWGYSRWLREHIVPQRHQKLFSRHLEISPGRVNLITHDHEFGTDVQSFLIDLNLGLSSKKHEPQMNTDGHR